MVLAEYRNDVTRVDITRVFLYKSLHSGLVHGAFIIYKNTSWSETKTDSWDGVTITVERHQWYVFWGIFKTF